jgi:predicted alpha-1,2-mannosidase
MDVEQFVKKGYVPYVTDPGFVAHSGGATFSISHTLEYGFSAYATAQLAKQLGYEEDYKTLMELSDGWAKVFDDELKLVRPRYGNGEFIENFNPYESWRGFQEGNAMQYSFFVPQNPDSLVTRMGGEEFNTRLDNIFTEARKTIFGGGKTTYAFAGISSPYNHGNQPSLHIPWLFNFSGKPYLTQKWTRLICDEFYGTDGEHGYGYGQDEDQGQLGAWFVMAGIGLFDVKVFTEPDAELGLASPLFSKVRIQLDQKYYPGKEFTIIAKDNGGNNNYIQSIKLNGQTLHRSFVPWSSIKKGGTLNLQMGEKAVDIY